MLDLGEIGEKEAIVIYFSREKIRARMGVVMVRMTGRWRMGTLEYSLVSADPFPGPPTLPLERSLPVSQPI